MNEEKKEVKKQEEEEQKTTTPKTEKIAISPAILSAPGETIPTPPLNTIKTEKEVNIKDLTKLNETLTKRIEKLEQSQNLTKNEPKPNQKTEEKKQEQYVPTIQKTKTEEKPKLKNVVNGIYIG